MKIYCCRCTRDVDARLTTGFQLYPRRADLSRLPFWVCDSCGNSVGCHHKTNRPHRPLGVIAHRELKEARQHIHKLLDPLWQDDGPMTRGEVYKAISERIGKQYHTAELRTVEEAREVYLIVRELVIDAREAANANE